MNSAAPFLIHVCGWGRAHLLYNQCIICIDIEPLHGPATLPSHQILPAAAYP